MAERKPRAKRRNFTEERKALVMFCEVNIQILSEDIDDLNDAKIKAFKSVLREMGEGESE